MCTRVRGIAPCIILIRVTNLIILMNDDELTIHKHKTVQRKNNKLPV